MRTILAAIVAVIVAGNAFAAERSLPDPVLTPGVATTLTAQEICARPWGKDRRFVTEKMKREVRASYGNPVCRPDKHGRRIEIDHCISRELGGADHVRNLWPQCYAGKWNAAMKDRLENRLHQELCAGRITLEQAQRDVCGDWTKAYRRYFGEPK